MNTFSFFNVLRTLPPPRSRSFSRSCREPKGNRCPFTLLEMIVVLVIAAILTIIAAPAFLKIATASGVKVAAKALGSQVNLTRQHALARRRYVALILPGPRESACGIDPRYYYTCYRQAYVTRSGSTYTFSAWVERTNWQFLPKGVSIMEADGDIGINQIGSTGVFTRLPADNAYSKVNAVDFRDLGGNDSVDGVRAVIFSPAGKLKGDSRFISVGEALKTGSTWTIKNPVPAGDVPTNESCANQLTLEINRYTGGIRYKTPEQY